MDGFFNIVASEKDNSAGKSNHRARKKLKIWNAKFKSEELKDVLCYLQSVFYLI